MFNIKAAESLVPPLPGMRRLSQNLVTISLLLDHQHLQLPNTPALSGTSLGAAGEKTLEDKSASRFQNTGTGTNTGSMKAAVPCLVLGSTFVSAILLAILSSLILN